MNNIKLKNFTFLSSKEINQLAEITTKPEIMKYIADGKIYNKSDLIEFKENEKKQNKLIPTKRFYWTYAILDGEDVIGMFVLYKIYLNKFRPVPISKRRSKLNFAGTKKNNNPITINTRILINTTHQGKGVGVKVYEIIQEMARKILFKNVKKPVYLISFVNTTNDPGNKLQIKAGFKLYGIYENHEKKKIFNVYKWLV
jgi:hypothetical protein